MGNLRLPSWPVWLIVVGLAMIGAAVIGVGFSAGFRPRALAGLMEPGGMPPGVALDLVGGTLGVIIFSNGLLFWLLVSSRTHERAMRGYASIWTILALLIAAILLNVILTTPYLLTQVAASNGRTFEIAPGTIVLALVTLDGPLVGLLYFRIVRPRVLNWAEMGWTTQHFWQNVGIGLAVGCVAFIAAAIAGEVLKAVGIESSQMAQFASIKGANLAQFSGVLLAGSVIAPVCEETFFRGYVFTAFRRANGVSVAVLGSSVLFALSHVNLTVFLPILVVGVIFSLAFWRTGSLVPSVVAHAVLNGVGFIAFYLQP